MKILTKLMQGLLRVISALPLGFHYVWAGFFTWLLRDVMHYRRDEVIAETIWFGGCRNPERLHRKRLVEYTNIDAVEAALAESPGVVVLNSHFGNWELTGGCLNYDYRPNREQSVMNVDNVIAVYKPLSSRMWDEIMRVNRCAPVLRDGCAVQKSLAAQSRSS